MGPAMVQTLAANLGILLLHLFFQPLLLEQALSLSAVEGSPIFWAILGVIVSVTVVPHIVQSWIL